MAASKINNAFFLIFGQGINFLFNLFMLPLLVRQLPIDTYSTYSQVLLITSTLYPILSLGIGNGMVAFFNSDNKHNFNIVLNSIVNVTLFSIVIYLVLFFFSDLLENQLKNNQLWEFLSFFFFSVCLQIFNDFLFNFMVFSEESKKASLLIIINNILRLSAIYLAIAFNLGLFYIFLFQLAVLFLGLLIYFVNILKKIGLPKFEWDKNLNIQLIKLSVPLSLTTIIGVLLIQTDGFVISNYLGKINYAYYRTGATEIPFLSTIYGSIALIMLPEIKKHLLNLNFEKIIELKRKIILNTALIIYPAITYFIFNADFFIKNYLGDNFSKSIPVFMIYNLILYIRINDYHDILILNKKSSKVLIIYLISFIVNIPFAIISVKFFGIVGPVFSTILISTIINFTSLYYVSKELNTKILHLYNFSKVVIVLIFDVLFIFVLKHIITPFYLSELHESILILILFFTLHFTFFYKIGWIDKSIEEKLLKIIKLNVWNKRNT